MADERSIEKAPGAQEVSRVEHTRNRAHFRPSVDIVETADELLVMADMPGASAESIDIRFENGSLSIHGKVADRQDAGAAFLLREYEVGDFHRMFEVSEMIDPERIHAEYKLGVLTLHLPKADAAKPRKIAVKGS